MHSRIKKCAKTPKLKPGLLAFYDIWSGNRAGLFSKEEISKEGDNTHTHTHTHTHV